MKKISMYDLATADFFSLIGMEAMSDEDKLATLEKMSQTVHARIYLKIVEQLSPEDRAELEAKPSEEILPYLEKKGFNFVQLTLEESLQYRYELASAFSLATESQE